MDIDFDDSIQTIQSLRSTEQKALRAVLRKQRKQAKKQRKQAKKLVKKQNKFAKCEKVWTDGPRDIIEREGYIPVEGDRNLPKGQFPIKLDMQVQKEARRQRGRDRKFASSMRMESEGQGFGSGSGRGRGTGRMQLVDLTECDSSFQVPGGGHRGGGVGRHPDGLKGREIGLWYANKNKCKKDMKAGRKEAQQEDAERKNRTFVTLDAAKERRLTHLLTTLCPDFEIKQEPETKVNDVRVTSSEARYSRGLDDDTKLDTKKMNNIPPFWSPVSMRGIPVSRPPGSGFRSADIGTRLEMLSRDLQDDHGLQSEDHWRSDVDLGSEQYNEGINSFESRGKLSARKRGRGQYNDGFREHNKQDFNSFESHQYPPSRDHRKSDSDQGPERYNEDFNSFMSRYHLPSREQSDDVRFDQGMHSDQSIIDYQIRGGYKSFTDSTRGIDRPVKDHGRGRFQSHNRYARGGHNRGSQSFRGDRGNDRFHWSRPADGCPEVEEPFGYATASNYGSTTLDHRSSHGPLKIEGGLDAKGGPKNDRNNWFIDRKPNELEGNPNELGGKPNYLSSSDRFAPATNLIVAFTGKNQPLGKNEEKGDKKGRSALSFYSTLLRHPGSDADHIVEDEKLKSSLSSVDLVTKCAENVETVAHSDPPVAPSDDRDGNSLNVPDDDEDEDDDDDEEDGDDDDDDIECLDDYIVVDEVGDDDDDATVSIDEDDEENDAENSVPVIIRDDEDDVGVDYDAIVVEESADEDDGVGDFLAEFHAHARDDNSAPKNDGGRSLQRDVKLDARLQKELSDKLNQSSYRKMLEKRSRLPSYQMKQKVIDEIKESQVIVISGETGCGKTTQVTQFILDDWIERGEGSMCRIVCTQPRRISAITVAERVADERCEPIGQSVGYQIRLEQKLARTQGSILYCTTGILLKWLLSDPLLSLTTHVVLDEVHERDTLTDFLMIVLRDLIQRRSDLKLILMSATLNADQFSVYFNNCAMFHIPGFTFPVQHLYLEDIIETIRYSRDEQDKRSGNRFPPGANRNKMRELEQVYQTWITGLGTKYSSSTLEVLRKMAYTEVDVDYKLVASIVHHILKTTQDGAILVFMPGWEQIKKTIDMINIQLKSIKGKLLIVPLHSMMPTVNQREVFDHPPNGVRKIIVATNIAETSITIDDVVYVIDCGKIKMKNFDVESNLSTLQAEWVSRANAKQRAGRAGRVQAGSCYHLFTTLHESQMADYQLPEILRTRLEELCLQIKMLKLGRIQEFISKALEPPSIESLQLAINILRNLNALDANESLTPLGYHLAKMPVDPQTGKMLLFAALFSCLDPILTIAASLSFKDAFYAPLGQEKNVDARRREIAAGSKSDHLMIAKAFQGWERAKSRGYGAAKHYCRENYLSDSILQMLQGMRRQFAKTLCDMKFLTDSDPKSYEANRNTGNMSLVKAVICAGLYPNVAKRKMCKGKKAHKRPLTLMTKTEDRVDIHPKSVNATSDTQSDTQWFVYHLIMKTSKIYVYDTTSISPYPLMFFGGEITARKDLGENCIIIDDWITFGASPRTASLVLVLRRELDKLMRYKITHPGAISWKTREEGDLMAAIIDLVTTEMDTPNQNRRVSGPY